MGRPLQCSHSLDVSGLRKHVECVEIGQRKAGGETLEVPRQGGGVAAYVDESLGRSLQ